MMNKICHLTSVHPELDTRIFWKECVSLQKAGFDVSLVVAGAEDKVVEGVKIHGVRKYTQRFQRILKSGAPILEKAIEIDADVYHFHDSELLSVGVQLRKRGKTVIYDSHEDLPRQILTKPWIPKVLRPLVSRWVERYENGRAKKMSCIVAATPHIRERFAKVTTAPVECVCNYPILNEITETTEWTEKQKAACYVGGIFPERGIFEMVRAIEKTDARLKLAGAFSPATLQQQVEQEPGWQKVDFAGYIGRKEINRMLGESMVGLLLLHPMPSYIDSLPIKLFEYMAAGIPVVCSDFPLWRDIVEGSGCGVCIDPMDTGKAAAAIQKLIDSPEEAHRMGTAGRKAALSIYNWDSQAEILINLYKNLTK